MGHRELNGHSSPHTEIDGLEAAASSVQAIMRGENVAKKPSSPLNSPPLGSIPTAATSSLSPQNSNSPSVLRSHSFRNTLRNLVRGSDGCHSATSSPLPNRMFRKKLSEKKPSSPSLSTGVKSRPRSKSRGSVTLSPPIIMRFRENKEIKHGSLDIPVIHIDSSVSSPVTPDLVDVISPQHAASNDEPILSPPPEFKGSFNSLDRSASLSLTTKKKMNDHETPNLNSFFRRYQPGSELPTPRSPMRHGRSFDCILVESSPNPPDITTCPSDENLFSLNDALTSYNHYSSETGLMTKSNSKAGNHQIVMPSPSPSPPFSPPSAQKGEMKEDKRKSKKSTSKKKRHRVTVDVDNNTVKEIRQNVATGEDGRNASEINVKQLVRNISRKLKEHNKIFDTHSEELLSSAQVEDSTCTSPPSGSENSNVSDGDVEREGGVSCPTGPHLCDNDSVNFNRRQKGIGSPIHRHRHSVAVVERHKINHNVWEEEESKKGKVKGWMKSLTSKFMKKEGN